LELHSFSQQKLSAHPPPPLQQYVHFAQKPWDSKIYNNANNLKWILWLSRDQSRTLHTPYDWELFYSIHTMFKTSFSHEVMKCYECQ
jgi:hypothetical protein